MPKTYRDMIGDGKFPNKYWVSWSNDFSVCKKGMCDWIGDSIKNWKSTGKTETTAFKTFKEAMDFVNRKMQEMPEIPREDSINRITVEDRLSGEVYEASIVAYKKKVHDVLNKTSIYAYDTSYHNETSFTKKEMEKNGYEFK